MHIHIWIGHSYLEQLNKNINCTIPPDEVFDSAVEFTEIAVMQGQTQVSIKFDDYIKMTDCGLLVQWSGANNNEE